MYTPLDLSPPRAQGFAVKELVFCNLLTLYKICFWVHLHGDSALLLTFSGMCKDQELFMALSAFNCLTSLKPSLNRQAINTEVLIRHEALGSIAQQGVFQCWRNLYKTKPGQRFVPWLFLHPKYNSLN